VFSALIIDAERNAAQHIEDALSPFGFEFTVTQDNVEAMDLARNATPDIIFLRVELPNVSGFSVCNKLRRNDETKYIPLVMYASGVSTDVFNQHRNLKTHADEYLKLPFAPEALVAAVRNSIELPEIDPDGAPEVEEEDDEPGVLEAAPLDLIEDPQSVSESEEQDAYSFTTTNEDSSEQNIDDLEDATDAAFEALVSVEEDDASEDGESAMTTSASSPIPTPVEAEPEPAQETSSAREPPPPPSNSGGGTEFRAQREVIQLKSELNAKKRELLSLREEMEHRERAVLDANHRNRELLSQIGDLEEKLLGAEEQTITAREKTDAALRDLNFAVKREEGFRSRLEQATLRIRELEGNSAKLTDSEGAVTTLRSELRTTQAELIDLRHELELTTARSAELEQAKTDAETSLAEQKRIAEQREDDLMHDIEAAKTAADFLREQVAELRLAAARVESTAAAELHGLRQESEAEKAQLLAQEQAMQQELERLGSELEELKRSLGIRHDVERRAQQAIAVALRVLDGQIQP